MTIEYSLSGVLERIYSNELALEAAIMELVLLIESLDHAEVGDNIRGTTAGHR